MAPSESKSQPQHMVKPTECIVHHLLDRQRRGHDEDGPSELPAAPLSSWSRQFPHEQMADQGLNQTDGPTPVDETQKKTETETISAGASSHVCPFGQADEQKWTDEMMSCKNRVEMGFPTDEEDHGTISSRLLTKKQLSEMAWGVRELGRRLGSMRIRFAVRKIFLLTKIYDHDLIRKTRELTRWLLAAERDTRYVVYVEDSLRDMKEFDAPRLLAELGQSYADKRALGEDEKWQGHGQEGAATVSERLRYWNADMCRKSPHDFDFVVTLGGDGTVLFASWLFQRMVPPVLSFALGSLGFLTKFDFEDYQATMTDAFANGVTIGLRLRFEGTVMRSRNLQHDSTNGVEASSGGDEQASHMPMQRDLVQELIGEGRKKSTHTPDATYEILNEFVVDRGPNPTLSYLEVFGDDEHFTSVLADGICVSTPTGSTAYNLAAGGSLCHPENPVMLVTSICAHTLSFRPIILPDTIVLRIGVPYKARTGSWVSFDGRERVELFAGDYVTISASRYPFASVQAEGKRSEDWVNGISAKLGWNTRQLQREYKEWQG